MAVTELGPALADTARARLRGRVAEAIERAARHRRPVVAAVTLPLDPSLDVSGCVFASRRAEERYFAWEQPDRDRFAIGALGSVVTIEGVPAHRRFAAASAHAVESLRDAVIDGDLDAPGAGPLWVGGFAFSPSGGRSGEWGSLPSSLLVLPAITIHRHAGACSVTATALCRAGDHADDLSGSLAARLGALRAEPLPLVDPDPLGGYEIASTRPPEEYERAVAEGARLVAAGHLRKVVLAREVTVTAARAFKAGAVFGALRAGYPTCYCYCVGTPEAAFLGASPELLLRRSGALLSTVALAGSTRRSADPAVDDHLGERLLHSAKDLIEHQSVVRTIERSLEPASLWVTSGEEPSLVRVANIQHLATPIRAQLTEPRSAVELAGLMHPTSAVGGEPSDRAEQLIDDLERLDRGWYAGPVGWMDAAEDGELCVALRCALLEGRTAHCYAGAGVVADSDPEAELAETEVKLQAVMPALMGV
jgi:isochorismate synthase